MNSCFCTLGKGSMLRRLQEMLECPICLQPADAPQLVSCCGQTLCGVCLQACLAQSKQCPLCRSLHPTYGDNRLAQDVGDIMLEYGRIARKRKNDFIESGVPTKKQKKCVDSR